MSIYIGPNEISSLKKGTSDVSEVYVGDTKVRPIQRYKTFTITWEEKSDMSSGWTYSDNATGLTAGSGDFDDFFGYEAVILNDSGGVVSTMQQSGGIFSDTMTNFISGKTGNVMIRFPKRGIKMTKSGSIVTLSITDDPAKDGYQYYAFNDHGVAQDYLCLGAYEGYANNNKLTSVSGVKPTDLSLSGAITYVNNYNISHYHIISWYAYQYIIALYILKYGNPDNKTVIGRGLVSSSSLRNTGGTNSQTSATYGTTSTTTQMKLFGLEDWWGNKRDVMDGVYYNKSNNILQVDSTGAFSNSSKITTYNKSFPLWSNTYLTSITGTNDGMFVPYLTSSTYADYSKYYCGNPDKANYDTYVAFGGAYGEGYSSIFKMHYLNDTYGPVGQGSRLMYL